MAERDDAVHVREAIALARRGEGRTRPNPPVGAVVVDGAGRTIGRGWHRRCGGLHAETSALRDCRGSAKGATLYVTLEPCSRAGRVGACTDAIIASGVRRVVWACDDPNPANRRRAAKILRAAGIETESGVCRGEAEELIRPFAKRILTGLPYVTVKLAISLDGKAHDIRGGSKWISSAQARKATDLLRRRVDAIMVGAETVRKDDPSLLPHYGSNGGLHRVIVTCGGRLPRNAQVFTDAAKDRTIVARADGRGLRGVMEDLAARGFMHVLCEGGPTLAAALAAEGLVDEWVAVFAPCVIGAGPVAEAVRFSPAAAPELTSAGDLIWRCSACSRG